MPNWYCASLSSTFCRRTQKKSKPDLRLKHVSMPAPATRTYFYIYYAFGILYEFESVLGRSAARSFHVGLRARRAPIWCGMFVRWNVCMGALLFSTIALSHPSIHRRLFVCVFMPMRHLHSHLTDRYGIMFVASLCILLKYYVYMRACLVQPDLYSNIPSKVNTQARTDSRRNEHNESISA